MYRAALFLKTQSLSSKLSIGCSCGPENAIDVTGGSTKMAATQNALNYLVLAQLARLQKDQCRLENLYAQLPAGPEPKVEERFLALWKDVDNRAARLERM